jgi:hypothetical protein
MAGIEAPKATPQTIDATPQPIDARSIDPFSVHPALQFSIPLKPVSVEDQQRELELEHALMSKDGEWNRLYGPPQTAKSAGFGLEVEHVRVPFKSGLTLWDLRSSSLDPAAPTSNFEERYQEKGSRFGLNWTKAF